MEAQFIAAKTLCLHYDIEISFVETLSDMGLIQIEIIENAPCIHEDEITTLEKIIRLQNDLNLNLEGIDIIFNLLNNERVLREEINLLKNRLSLYEND